MNIVRAAEIEHYVHMSQWEPGKNFIGGAKLSA